MRIKIRVLNFSESKEKKIIGEKQRIRNENGFELLNIALEARKMIFNLKFCTQLSCESSMRVGGSHLNMHILKNSTASVIFLQKLSKNEFHQK